MMGVEVMTIATSLEASERRCVEDLYATGVTGSDQLMIMATSKEREEDVGLCVFLFVAASSPTMGVRC